MNDTVVATPVAKVALLGSIVAPDARQEGISYAEFRKGPVGARASGYAPLGKAPTLAELLTGDDAHQARVMPLLNSLIAAEFVDAGRKVIESAIKSNEAGTEFTFPALPESFNPIETLLAYLEPAARAARASAAASNYALDEATFKGLLDIVVLQVSAAYQQKVGKVIAPELLKKLKLTFEKLLTGKVTETVCKVLIDNGNTPFFQSCCRYIPGDLLSKVSARLAYVAEKQEDFEKAKEAGKDAWNTSF